jgi:hypothetical protein
MTVNDRIDQNITVYDSTVHSVKAHDRIKDNITVYDRIVDKIRVHNITVHDRNSKPYSKLFLGIWRLRKLL